MTMLQLFGYTAGILGVVCILPYLRDIFRGTTKPERASWFIWTVLGSIAFFSQLAKGATDSLWMTAAQATSVAIIFLLSIKYGVGGFHRRDIIALFLAAVGLLLWYITSEAAIALFIVIGIDFIGSVLTVLKAYEKPESETVSTWVIAGISGVFGMLAVGSLNWILLAYPLYIFLTNAMVTSAILLGKRRKR